MENAAPARRGRPPGIRSTEGELTSRQAAIVRCITETVRRQGYPPSMREIMWVWTCPTGGERVVRLLSGDMGPLLGGQKPSRTVVTVCGSAVPSACAPSLLGYRRHTVSVRDLIGPRARH
ncbi:hypothetical protein PV396_43360 [Streptomyces sp. ME02-8801-2C]|uniref:LexA family protein n=1 Tax=Streptomyces sp. ME02-8801-2C TaxID=3028680 RepID=UPI0029A97F3F|nr:hypothetical protein [Streptomyces sp. ME02-8801-2C]MDX3458691.1 hypothetical protein [Streptomyces sp. ME02-8801-2C]